MNTSAAPEPTAVIKRRGKQAIEVVELHRPDAEAQKRALRLILNAPDPSPSPSNRRTPVEALSP